MPAGQRCGYKGGIFLLPGGQGLSKAVDAVFREAAAIVPHKHGCKLIFIDTGLKQGVVFVVIHDRTGVHPFGQKKIDGIILRYDLRPDAAGRKKSHEIGLEGAAPQADPFAVQG